jgi:hypothetical protein
MNNPFKKLPRPSKEDIVKDKARAQDQRLKDLQRQARMLGVELDVLRKDAR